MFFFIGKSKKLFKIIKDEMKDYEAFLKKTRKPFVKHAHTSDLVQMEKNEEKRSIRWMNVIYVIIKLNKIMEI